MTVPLDESTRSTHEQVTPMPFQPLTIEVADLTLNRLDDYVSQARSAGAIGDNPVVIEAVDDVGNPVDTKSITIEIDY